VTTTANPTGVPNPDKPGWWIVPPWEAGASFCDIVRHFLRFDPWRGGASRGHQLTYYTAYLTALKAAPTSELTHATSWEWRDELLSCIAKCVANYRAKSVTECLHNKVTVRRSQPGPPATSPTPAHQKHAS
jgi:hypothetical protein